MRNMLIALAAVAALISVGNAFAASPTSQEAPSVLVESASDVPSVSATQPVTNAHMTVNHEMEPPVVYNGTAVSPPPQPIHQPQEMQQRTYRRPQPKKQQNVFEQLMELERRKNAWLKKTFLGR